MAATLQSAEPRAARRDEVLDALNGLLPARAILSRHEDTVPYECDGLTAYRASPLVVVLPESEDQVSAILKVCHALDVPVVARGAGTGLSGGALPHALGVTLSLAKFNRIVSLDPVACTAVVQCGVRNIAISQAAEPHGPLLRTGSEQPDCLHHRRQRRGELGWCPLPQVRSHFAQRAPGAGLHDGWRTDRVRLRCARRVGT